MLHSAHRGQALRSASGSQRYQQRTRRTLRCAALFGWGKKQDEEAEDKYDAKEEQWQIQQQLRAKRKTGELIAEANARRSAVRQTLAERKAERKQERDLLGKGIMPDTLKGWKNYKKKEDEGVKSGIVVPLLPFGNVEYDEGERFDLRSPYADEGWVDPEETDMFAGLKNFAKKTLNFSGKEPESQVGKPILWASEWSRQQREKEQKQKKRK